MPIYQRLVYFDEMFSTLTNDPIIINNIPNETEEDKQNIEQTISARYKSDMITLLPTCRCGETKGEFLIGTVCDTCNTKVKPIIEDEIEPSVWFAKPIGVTKLINPIVLIILRNRFRKSGFDVIQWLIDVKYTTAVKVPKVVNTISQSGIQKGYNNFVENFDSILEYLFSLKEFRLPKKQKDYTIDFIKEYRHLIFSDQIPLPNKSILIIENTNTGRYTIDSYVGAIDAIQMLVSIDRSFYNQNPKIKENRTAKALCKLTDFYLKYLKNNIAKDSGMFRKHIFGSRTNFSFRAVITSITEPHQYDELHIPWGIGLTVLKPHLLNKLIKLGMSMDAATGLLLAHIERYHDLLDKLLQELIDESPGKRLPVLFHRNERYKCSINSL